MKHHCFFAIQFWIDTCSLYLEICFRMCRCHCACLYCAYGIYLLAESAIIKADGFWHSCCWNVIWPQLNYICFPNRTQTTTSTGHLLSWQVLMLGPHRAMKTNRALRIIDSIYLKQSWNVKFEVSVSLLLANILMQRIFKF